jgi:hypothetical protein
MGDMQHDLIGSEFVSKLLARWPQYFFFRCCKATNMKANRRLALHQVPNKYNFGMENLISTQKSTHRQIMHLFNMNITWIFLEINNFSTFPKQVNWRMITMAPTVDIPFGWCLLHHTFDKHLMMWLFWKIPRYWH